MKNSPIKLAFAAVIGIMSVALLGLWLTAAVFAAMLLCFIIYSTVTHRFDAVCCALLAVFIAAASSYAVSSSSLLHKSLNYTNKYVTLNGYTVSTARKNSYNQNYSYILKATSVSNRHGAYDTFENIVLTTPQKLKCGSKITVKGIIKDLPKQMNDDGFNSEIYYKSQNAFSRIYSDDIAITDNSLKLSFGTIGGILNENIDALIFSHYKDDGAAILSAILTGNKYHFSEEYDSALSVTAFKHIFHPAYLHILFILTILELLLKCTKKKIRSVLAAIIFTCYAILQYPNIGFSRCLICCVAAIYYKLRYGSSYLPDIIAVIVLICSVIAPAMIFNVAFILSIACALMIWAFVPHITRRLDFMPRRLQRPTALIITFAFIISPVTAYFYSSFCIYSLLYPFITAPIVACIMLIAPITLAMMCIFGTAPLLGGYLGIFIKILYKIPFVIEKLPLAQINISRPTPCVTALIISVIFTVYFALRKRQYRFEICSAVSIGLLAAAIITVIPKIGTVEFMFVNVGQGDGAVIRSYGKETIIIDGGGGNTVSAYNPGKSLFVPYLKRKGINRIDAAIVSHYHQDHIQGVIETIKHIKTDVVFAPEIHANDSDTMKHWANELKIAAKSCDTDIYYISEPSRITFPDGLTLDIYAPASYLSLLDENNTSVPVQVKFGDFSALYTGDMTSVAETAFAETVNPQSDVLKVSHHGSNGSSNSEFLNAVSPQIAVISCGENNFYSHPHAETLSRLSDTGAKILRTDELGDIRIRANHNGEFKIEY